MRRSTRLTALGLLLSLLPAHPAWAQRFHTQTYTVSDGLPSAIVHAAAQDTLGQMWFATRTGIAIYDGHHLTVQGYEDGLLDLDQRFLLRDRGGRMWAAGRFAYSIASYHDGERWIPVGAPASNDRSYEVYAAALIPTGPDQTLLLGSDSGDVVAFHPDHGWQIYSLPGVGIDEPVTNLTTTADGGLLTLPSRILRVHGQPGQLEFRELARSPEGEFIGTALAPDGGIWVVGTEQIHLWRDGQLTPVARAPQLVLSNTDTHYYMRATTTEPDGFGGFYAASIERAMHYHPDYGPRAMGMLNGMVSEGATSITTDREGNVWFTGQRGITKLIDLSLSTLDATHGLLEDEVSAALQRRDGSMVLGHPTGLSFVRGHATSSIEFRPTAVSGRVLDLCEDADGTLWVSAADQGLLRIDPSGNHRWFLRGQHVNSAIRDGSGRLWICTSNDLHYLEGDRFVPLGLNARLKVTDVQGRRFFPAADGGFYLASRSYGLLKLQPDGSHEWTLADREPPGVYALLEISDGVTWVGTGDGLFAVTANGYLTVGVDSPGPRIDRPVYFLVRDTVGDTWIGTDNGVFRWNGEELRHITVQDGFAGRETNRAAGVVDVAGRVWMGTEHGVSVFDRNLALPRDAGPLAFLDAVEVDGQSHPLGSGLELGHDQNSLTFRFTTISFLDERRTQVESWLEGFDPQWLAAYQAPLQEIRYTNLSPGRYRFHMRAIDAAGQRSPTVSSATIVITPALWQRPWFLILMALGAIGILFSWFLVVSRVRYARRLEREVSERVRELRESEVAKAAESRRLMVTLESITDAVITTDPHGAILLFNPAAESITGWTAAEVVERPLAEVLQLRSLGDRAPLAEGKLPHGDMALIARSGKSCTVEITSAPVRGGTVHGGTVLAFRDITEKRAVEAELVKSQRLQSLGILAGGIAHDFNNLLTVILGNVSLVSVGTEVEQKRLDDARDATLRARALTKQLLTFSRGGAPMRTTTSVAEVVRDNVALALSGSSSHGELDLPEELWAVDIDPGQIGQVISNLVLNASQAMPNGGTVRVRGENVRDEVPGLGPGDYVLLSVEDTGDGIPREHLPQIFDPYFSTKPEGTGLGLATAYSIVRRHDGLLSVESKAGQGTIFRIHLPRSFAARPTADRVAATTHVLVMDDDDDVLSITAALLKSSGFVVELARDGQEAIDTYRTAMEKGRRFGAILMDLTVRGGMGGREAMEQILRIDPDARGIVASGYSHDPVLADHAAYGFRARIIKPYLGDDLRAVLFDVMDIGPQTT